MIACPSCGGNLLFNIQSQDMICAYCSTHYDPYEVEPTSDAEGGNDYEVSVFSCPQCGGEIYSTDQTVAGFCSFCGASTMLTQRLQKQNKPAFIIPFQMDKEECKNKYAKMMRRAIYAPKELKSKRHIQEFRGIYMPYWLYRVEQKGPIALKGESSHRSGDYIITEHFNVTGNLDTTYDGLSYDASSSFSDNISEKLAPYDLKQPKKFASSFMSGFYGDLPDVDADVYADEVELIAAKNTKNWIDHQVSCSLTQNDTEIVKALHTNASKCWVALLPVWFMTYRKKNRVAYATVNGQTGKVVADLPVDLFKYFIGTTLGAVIIYLLLELFATIRPASLLALVAIIAALTLIFYGIEMKQIANREQGIDDLGLTSAREKSKRLKAEREAAAAREAGFEEPYVMPMNQMKKQTFSTQDLKASAKKNTKKIIARIMIIVYAAIFVGAAGINILSSIGVTGTLVFSVLSFIFSLVFGIKSIIDLKSVDNKSGYASIWAIFASGIALVISIIKPVSDLYYYVAVGIMMLGVGITLIDLIRSYNILATRKMPQFDYKGGDNRA